ncbi:MAG: hypothetical protein J5833_02805, partial [Victivallales bacterium]|nr:hypothetical protein [Victivallales bacterium]
MPDDFTPQPNEQKNKDKKSLGNGFVFKQLVLWAIVLIVTPFMIHYVSGGKESKPDVLTSSQFENLLAKNRIHSVLVEEQSSTSILKLSGNYWPESIKVGTTDGLKKYTTKVIYTDTIDNAIRANCGIRDVKQNSGFWGSIILSILPIVIISLLFYIFFIRQM